MKQKKSAVEKPRENTPLLFLLLLLFPLFGGYYDFSAFLAGVALVPLLLYAAYRAGKLTLPTGWEAWCLYGLAVCTLLAVPFAVSPGAAFTGFLRKGIWVLFFLYAATYTAEERSRILDAVAYEGAILSLFTMVGYVYDELTGVTNANGRIDGLFQYANTWSLYLFLCLILLVGKPKRSRWDYPAMLSLLAGVFLSGSRGVYLLLFGFAVLFGVGYGVRKKQWKPLALGGGAILLVGVAAAAVSGGVVLRRLQAMTLASSSLNGRLLYIVDGLRMIGEHPLGVGRLGYLYLQPFYQTGVYILRYIHNEYLQAALDGGVLAGVLLAGCMACMALRKDLALRERAVILAAAAHAFIDFDLQYTAVVFLVLLCGAGGRKKELALPPVKVGVAAGGVLALALGFFTLVYTFSFTGNAAGAYALYPWDIAIAEDRLQSFGEVDPALPVADRLTGRTDVSMLAWDCKYADASRHLDLPSMVEYKYRYLLLNPYRGEVYEEFSSLLERTYQSGDPAQRQEYRELAEKTAARLRGVVDNTSPLAWRIADKPELDFADAVLARLEQIQALS